MGDFIERNLVRLASLNIACLYWLLVVNITIFAFVEPHSDLDAIGIPMLIFAALLYLLSFLFLFAPILFLLSEQDFAKGILGAREWMRGGAKLMVWIAIMYPRSDIALTLWLVVAANTLAGAMGFKYWHRFMTREPING